MDSDRVVRADGERIRRLRESKGLTQAELASVTRDTSTETDERFRVEEGMIQAAEKNEIVSPNVLIGLARVLLGDGDAWE